MLSNACCLLYNSSRGEFMRGNLNMKTTRMCTGFALLAGLVVMIAPLYGQNFYGSVMGTITDPSGANMANVKVSISNTATGERRTAETDTDGAYRFPNLLPGTYKVEVAQSGFKQYLRDNVAVQVESSVRLDIPMQIGDISQQI